MKKLYQIFFIDEYNNADELGWFENIDDCIEQINDRISLYGEYKIEKGDIKAQVGTFSEYIRTYISDVLEPRYGEEVYEEFQSCFIRGFVNCFNDETEFNLYKNLLVHNNETHDLMQERLSVERLIEEIEKGQNKAILKAYNADPKKFANDIMESIIEETMKKLSDSMQLDINKFNIDKSAIHTNEYWRMIEEDYDIQNGLTFQRVPNENIMKAFNQEEELKDLEHDFNYYENEKTNYDFLGCYIFNLEMIEYYTHEDKLYTYLYTFYNDEKYLSQILIADRKTNIN